MPRIRDILPAVLALRSGVIDQALSSALTTADPEELGQLGEAMLGRGKASAAEALVVEYDRLPRELQHKVVARAEELATPVRRAATRRGLRGAKNALTIIGQAASTRMAYLVTALLRHSDPEVRDLAGRCLVSLAKRCRSSQEPGQMPHLDAVSTQYLINPVEQAVVLFRNHDHPAVLEALLWLAPHAVPEACAALRLAEHAALGPLAHRLAAENDPATRRAAFAFIGVRPLAEACRSALAEANSRGRLAEPLETGHLLSLPANRRELRRARQPDTLWPDARQVSAMPTTARRWLPCYLAALPIDRQEQVMRLARLTRAADAATRLAVLRRLLVLARPLAPEDHRAADNANDTLAVLTRDPEPTIARTALWHLIQIGYAGLPRILADLVNSRHPEVRTVAAKRLAPMGFERYWEAWPKLDPRRRLAAGRALIKIDGDFHRHLGARLATRDPDKRLRALGIIAALNQGAFFEEVLLDLAGGDDPKLVASAIKALGGCTSQTAQEVLQLALDHDDARIRANAVEAIGKAQAAANLDKLLAMVDDPAQRPRANAIKTLLELRAKDALPALTRMLTDQRARHRVSALWLIDELGLLQVARQVAEMSISDEDEQVKHRAGQVIQRLIEDLEHQVAEHQQLPSPTEAA